MAMVTIEVTNTEELVPTELAVAFVPRTGATSRGPVLQTTETIGMMILKSDTGKTTIQ
jgi:hypothetical protein